MLTHLRYRRTESNAIIQIVQKLIKIQHQRWMVRGVLGLN